MPSFTTANLNKLRHKDIRVRYVTIEREYSGNTKMASRLAEDYDIVLDPIKLGIERCVSVYKGVFLEES